MRRFRASVATETPRTKMPKPYRALLSQTYNSASVPSLRAKGVRCIDQRAVLVVYAALRGSPVVACTL